MPEDLPGGDGHPEAVDDEVRGLMEAGRGVEISVSPLVDLIQKENLGEPHPVFAGGEQHVVPGTEQVLQRELAAAGWGDRRDYLDLVALVSVVQRSTTEFYGWVTGVDCHFGVLVCSLDQQAVSLVRSGGTVRCARCEPDRMVEALVRLLPDVVVARGDAVSVGHDDFHAASSRTSGTAAARSDEVRRLDELLDTQRMSVTKLYAARRDAGGVRQRSPRWVTVLDLVDGRWALAVTRSRQERRITAAPGSPQVLAERLAELARSIG